MKPIVTMHAIIRWFERVEDVDMNALRHQAKEYGINHKSETALVNYMHHVAKLDVPRVRKMLSGPKIVAALEMGAASVVFGRWTIVLGYKSVITIKPTKVGPGLPNKTGYSGRRDRRKVSRRDLRKQREEAC